MAKIKKTILLLCFAFMVTACEYITEVEDISGKTITVLAPKNETVIDTSAIFSWEILEDADHYHVQVAKPSFENASQIVTDTLVEKNSYTQNLLLGNYEWRVRAENSGYKTNYTSQIFIVE